MIFFWDPVVVIVVVVVLVNGVELEVRAGHVAFVVVTVLDVTPVTAGQEDYSDNLKEKFREIK